MRINVGRILTIAIIAHALTVGYGYITNSDTEPKKPEIIFTSTIG